jgi:hypothetical protein
MRGVVMGDLATEVMVDLPDDDARDEVMELLERVRDRDAVRGKSDVAHGAHQQCPPGRHEIEGRDPVDPRVGHFAGPVTARLACPEGAVVNLVCRVSQSAKLPLVACPADHG